MMLSILPEASEARPLPEWAMSIRDNHKDWMGVAQKGVEAFVAEAMDKKVSFARETVFSHWRDLGNGKFESKIDDIRRLQNEGYIVLLLFVGLTDSELSIRRVQYRATNKITPGHDVPRSKLISRFPRTQEAIKHALAEADMSILVDNSRTEAEAFTVCRVQVKLPCAPVKQKVYFDLRQEAQPCPWEIEAWMSKVCPDCLPKR